MTSSPASPRSEAPRICSIHQDFHEGLGLTFLICATDVFHGHGRDQRGLASLADFGFRHAGTAERGIRVERVSDLSLVG
jgi:hypothetical protein